MTALTAVVTFVASRLPINVRDTEGSDMPTRTFVVAAAGVGAALLTATGITYAATAGSTPDSAPAHRAAAPAHHATTVVQRASAPARKPAQPAEKTAPGTAPSGNN